jgi:hypothetical protein
VSKHLEFAIADRSLSFILSFVSLNFLMLVKYFYSVFPVTIGGKKKQERRRRFGLYLTKKKKKKKIWVIPDPEEDRRNFFFKKKSQLWAEIGMGFRYYLKCKKVSNLAFFNSCFILRLLPTFLFWLLGRV